MTLTSRLPRVSFLLAIVLLSLPVPAVADGSVPTCDGLPATLVGTEGDDVLTGTGRPDVIVGLGGRDEIAAGAGDDVVCAGPGDFLDLPDVEGVRSEHVDGGDGNDRLFGEAGVDEIDGGPGDDLVDLGEDAPTPEDEVYSTALGGAGDDHLVGGGGQERLFGGPGNDLLEGGDGTDYLFGEDGRTACTARAETTSRLTGDAASTSSRAAAGTTAWWRSRTGCGTPTGADPGIHARRGCHGAAGGRHLLWR